MARKSSNYEEAYLNTLGIIVQIDAAKGKKNRFRMKTKQSSPAGPRFNVHSRSTMKDR